MGYTNAGKTTLFNVLTLASAEVSDALFVTLDPLVRRVRVGDRRELLLSDTVGFIDRLPHALVAAFRATLEEVAQADLLLHVVDAAAGGVERRMAAVRRVLEEVHAASVPVLEVMNKCDVLDEAEKRRIQHLWPDAWLVSAATGEGCAALLDGVCARLGLDTRRVTLHFNPEVERDRQRMGQLVPPCQGRRPRGAPQPGFDRGRRSRPPARPFHVRRGGRAVKGAGRPIAREAPGTGRLLRMALLVCAAVIGSAAGACAPKTLDVPSGMPPRYPDYLFPVVPEGMSGPEARATLERGWRLLQAGDLGGAEQLFAGAIKASPSFFPAQTALGYAKLAGRAYDAALASFGRALEQSDAYVPGPGRQRRCAHRCLAPEGGHRELHPRPGRRSVARRGAHIAWRRFACAWARRRSWRRGRRRRGGTSTPPAARIRRRLRVRQTAPSCIANWLRSSALPGTRTPPCSISTRAADLDPGDAGVWVQMGLLFEERNDLEGAAAAYAQAAHLDPGPASSERLERARRGLAAATLPDQFRHIAGAQVTTRGDLAALVGVRLGALVDQATPREAAVITDVAGHWAAAWIRAVTRAGLMEVYPEPRVPAGRDGAASGPGAGARAGCSSSSEARIRSAIRTGSASGR